MLPYWTDEQVRIIGAELSTSLGASARFKYTTNRVLSSDDATQSSELVVSADHDDDSYTEVKVSYRLEVGQITRYAYAIRKRGSSSRESSEKVPVSIHDGATLESWVIALKTAVHVANQRYREKVAYPTVGPKIVSNQEAANRRYGDVADRLLVAYFEHQIKLGELQRIDPDTKVELKPYRFRGLTGKVVGDNNVEFLTDCGERLWMVFSDEAEQPKKWFAHLSNGFNMLGEKLLLA